MPKKIENFKTVIENFIKEMEDNNICFMGYAYDKNSNIRATFSNVSYQEDASQMVRNFIKGLYKEDKNHKRKAEAIMVGALLAMIDVGFVNVEKENSKFDPIIFN